MSDKIRLSKEQLVIQDELEQGIGKITEALAEPIDASNGDDIADSLASHSNLAAYSPRLMKIATLLRGVAHEVVANEILTSRLLAESKPDVQRLYISGQLNAFNAMYSEADTAVKGLDKHLEYLRSLLSMAKEQLNKRIGM